MNDRITPKNIYALRPVRILVKKNEFRNYEAVTFDNPATGCEMWMHRCHWFGWLKKGDDLAIDFLDERGDIIDTVPISRRGFNYLRGKLKFRVATTASPGPAGTTEAKGTD